MKTIKQLADELWEYAETGFEEYKSCKAMVEFLKEHGFEVESNIAGMETAYRGVYGSGKPVICFLAEYDALFGMNQVADITECKPITSNEATGHGCGHHLLGCGAIEAALQFKAYLEKNPQSGTCVILGCPAEESGSGKAYLARDGYLDDVDVALTWHPSNFNQVSTGSSQSCIAMFFKFHGVASHAASTPHLGRSALDACELMNIGVNYMREHMEDSDRVHYAYTNVGGKAPNVVQSEAELKYFIRSTTNPKCEKLKERVINIAKGAALMSETTVDIIFDEGLSNTVPNYVLEGVLASSFKEIYKYDYSKEEEEYAAKFKATYDIENVLSHLPSHVVDKAKLIADIKNNPINTYYVETNHSEECGMGSTDVGDISWVVPTAQINTACYSIGAGSHSWQWVAQGKSSLAYKGMKLAGDVLCNAAIKLIENPTLIEQAKAEFKTRLGDYTYECLIPKHVKPHISKSE